MISPISKSDLDMSGLEVKMDYRESRVMPYGLFARVNNQTTNLIQNSEHKGNLAPFVGILKSRAVLQHL